MRFNILKLITLLAATVSCNDSDTQPRMPLADKLEQNQSSNETVKYIARFDSETTAQEHIESVKAEGGQATTLRNDKKIVKAEVSSEAASRLEVPRQSEVVKDAVVKIKKSQSIDNRLNPSELADQVMTAKNVVGVDTLRTRYPDADGRGVVVAVFDTGIDFGLNGVSAGEGADRKLVGFYDLTDFARVTLSGSQLVTEQSNVIKIDDKEIRMAKSMAPKRIYGKGSLSEKVLARQYLAPQVDLDGNGKFNDSFLYLVGENAKGEPSVWVDINNDGQIKDAAAEELTDFNKTGKFVTMSTDTSPAGAKPLAVTFHNENEIQFHSVSNGHGTSCAIVIGGDGYANGYLQGMAPKTKFVSYMLDVTGQDVYTMSQFMDMFLHAREQKVDAISISWGFTVSDLKSARYFSRFLDEEIASHGIVIGIANGNEGPAFSSGYTTDYLPHHGFSVGAMISKDQAKNVYGWNGDVEDSVIWYSSFGPTRGGRQVPDVISPLMTMVRGERVAKGTIFKGFGGTSSATPALIGAMSAMMSQMKADGLPINPRLVKMAVMNTADPISHVDENRQGKGVINVSKAYDLYTKLVSEWESAKKDPSKSTRFPYELRAETKILGLAEKGEGLVIDGFEASKTVTVKLSKESLGLLDGLNFAEPLEVHHGEDFFSTQDSVLMQATGVTFSVVFDEKKLHLPGTYSDSIELRRPGDQVALLSVPVIVRVPYRVSENVYQIDSVNQTMTMNDQWRSVIHLAEPTALTFEGVAIDTQGGFGTYLGFFVQSTKGDIVYSNTPGLAQAVTPLSFTTGVLPVGKYELVMFRGGSRPAVVTPIQVTGAWRKPGSSVLASTRTENKVRVLVQSQKAATVKSAQLQVEQQIHTVTLKRDFDRERKGYYAELDANLSGEIGLEVAQNDVDRATEEFLNVSLAINNLSEESNMYRGWVNVFAAGAPMQTVSLEGKAEKVEVLAYPNIVNWDHVTTEELIVNIRSNLEKKIESEMVPVSPSFAAEGQVALTFDFKDVELPANVVVKLKLLSADGSTVETLEVK